MSMTRRARGQRGFALFLAIGLLVLVAVVLVALSQLTATVARQSRDAAGAAQLRQLLEAGQQVAQERLEAGEAASGSHTIRLPAPLKQRGGQLTIDLQGSGAKKRQATVRATLDDMAASQVLVYQRAGWRWRLVDARLTDAHRVMKYRAAKKKKR